MKIIVLLNELGVPCSDSPLYSEAMTHSSYRHENSEINFDSERLEFIGDSILNLIVALHFFDTLAKIQPKDLTGLRKKFVNNYTLALAAEKLSLEKYTKIGKGTVKEEKAKNRVLATTFEALIGAIFKDIGGMKAATIFVKKTLLKPFEYLIDEIQDYKSLILQSANQMKINSPVYNFTELANGDFFVICKFQNFQTEATGKQKKNTTQAASKLMYEKLKENEKLA